MTEDPEFAPGSHAQERVESDRRSAEACARLDSAFLGRTEPEHKTPRDFSHMRKIAKLGGKAKMAKLPNLAEYQKTIASKPSRKKARAVRQMWKHAKKTRRAQIREGMFRKWEERRVANAQGIGKKAFGKQV